MSETMGGVWSAWVQSGPESECSYRWLDDRHQVRVYRAGAAWRWEAHYWDNPATGEDLAGKVIVAIHGPTRVRRSLSGDAASRESAMALGSDALVGAVGGRSVYAQE